MSLWVIICKKSREQHWSFYTFFFKAKSLYAIKTKEQCNSGVNAAVLKTEVVLKVSLSLKQHEAVDENWTNHLHAP